MLFCFSEGQNGARFRRGKRYRMKRIVLNVVCWIAAVSLYGQRVELSGLILDEQTGQPVPMVHVRVGDIVTYTNDDGRFLLRIPPSATEDLEVLHMGYDTHAAPINPNEPYRIVLSELEPEPVDHGLTGKQVMQDVFARLPWNYELEDQLMLSYYKEKLVTGDQMIHLAEAILEVHIPANVETAPAMVRLIKDRVMSKGDIKHRGVKVKSGHATEMVQSSIWIDHSFLSSKNRWDYNYELIGRETHREEHLYIIDISPANRKGYVSGRIWVDEASFAIVRIEYFLYGNAHFDEERWVEEFQHHGHTYYLLRASFEGTWTEDDKEFTFTSLIVNTEVEANGEDTAAWDQFVKGNKFSFPQENMGTFTEDFWEDHNFIELSEAEMKMLK